MKNHIFVVLKVTICKSYCLILLVYPVSHYLKKYFAHSAVEYQIITFKELQYELSFLSYWHFCNSVNPDLTLFFFKLKLTLFLFIIDIDECSLKTDNCHKDATCSNTYASFECTCNNGFKGDGVSCKGKIRIVSFFILKN